VNVSAEELSLLNFYRASELHGGLVLGTCVGRAREPELMLDLTRHSAEELAHAQLWTQTIIAVGGRPTPCRDTYQRRYAAALGPPATLLEVLVLTQVFERRVFKHFTEHLHRPGVHPAIRLTLARMLADEKEHLSWVRRWLHEQDGVRGDLIRRARARYERADREIYDALLIRFGWPAAA
jgi:demethoxyubiquinone hydroxylase (CLK1/Coq7/Cat5 family)